MKAWKDKIPPSDQVPFEINRALLMFVVFCRIVDEDPHYVSESVVPTTSQLEALKRHIATTRALKNKRLGEFTETKLLIIQGWLDYVEQF